MTSEDAVTTIQNAGKYLVKSRRLEKIVVNVNAVEGSHYDHPDVQALSIFAVLIARVTGVRHDGWVFQICDNLGIPR
jgi:hypothetical protein